MNRYMRAFKHAVGVRRFVLGSTVTLILTLYGFARNWLNARGVDLPELPSWTLALLAALGFVCWWFWRYAVQLETEMEPRLSIVHDQGPRYEFSETRQTHTLQRWRYVRIEVCNGSTQHLDNCIVMLQSMRRMDAEPFSNAYTPVGLLTQHQFFRRRVTADAVAGGAFRLRGKQSKFIEVACLEELEKDSEIHLQYETLGYANMIPRGDYELVVRAYGAGMPTERKFRLYVSKAGTLTLE
jgi:hypothetical protein